LTAVYWRSIIFGHNHPPSGTTATYGKLLPSRKRRLALSFLGVNKTSPNVKKKSAENFIVHDGLWAWQPNGVLLGKILSANIEEQVHL
jgi:hypothetical protein